MSEMNEDDLRLLASLLEEYLNDPLSTDEEDVVISSVIRKIDKELLV